MKFAIYQDSVTGQRRSNQDRMGHCYTRESLMMMVADGMGGHLRGEVAAQLSLQAAASEFQAAARPVLPDPQAYLRSALRRGHRDILSHRLRESLPESPRTTAVVCVIQQGRAWWAHAGDSRLYLIRNGAVLERTRDHSKVQNLIDLGVLRPEEAEHHPERNMVLNCLGAPVDPSVETDGPVTLEPGDIILMCTDGVWAPLSQDALVRAMLAEPLEVSVPRLVRNAVDLAGPNADNATAVAMIWAPQEAAARTAAAARSGPGSARQEQAAAASHAGATGHASSHDPLDADAVERTIREIREAIARTGGS